MKKIIGVDVGGTKIRIVLTDFKGRVFREKEIKTVREKRKDLENIVSLIEEFNSKEVVGIGLGVPGYLDLKREKVINFPNLPGWKGFRLKSFLENKFKKKIEIENDVNCVALAEKRFGSGKKFNNFIVLCAGTGLGGGIIIDGDLYIGSGNASEFGQMMFFDEGKSFEELVSARAFEKIKNKKGPKRAYKDLGKNLGKGIYNLVWAFDPEIVLIGGGLSNAGEILIGPVRKYLDDQIGRSIKIKRVKLLKNGGAIGAASLLRKT